MMGLDPLQTQQEEEGGDEWLGSFSDMITLVLCFFIILTAIFAIKEGDVLEAAIDSLKGMGKAGTRNAALVTKREAIDGLAHSLDALAKSSQYQGNLDVEKQPDGIEIEINEDKGNALFASGSAKLTRGAKRLIFDLAKQILYPAPLKLFSIGLEFQPDLDNNNISVGLRGAFENNGMELAQNVVVAIVKPGSNWFILETIDNDNRKVYSVWKEGNQLNIFDPQQLIEILSRTITEIEIQGHTDSVPTGPRSKFPSNWELSLIRANNVRLFLEASDFPDVFLRKVHVSGYANNKPAVSPEVADNPEQMHANQNRNRRVIIFLATQ